VDERVIQMAKWGLTPFENAVRWLNPAAKQAFYAAAASRTINRGTWNGCAFNAGGEVIGRNDVTSVSRAAEAFDMPAKSVSNFIRQWDSLRGSDEEANRMLREAIERVGLFSPRGVLRLRTLTFTAQDEEEKAAFEKIDSLVSDPSITDEDLWTLIDGCKEAMELIGA
jgi:hypothetical protein